MDNLLFKLADAGLFLGEFKRAELEVRLVAKPDEVTLASSSDSSEEFSLSSARVSDSLASVRRGESVLVSTILSSLSETAL